MNEAPSPQAPDSSNNASSARPPEVIGETQQSIPESAGETQQSAPEPDTIDSTEPVSDDLDGLSALGDFFADGTPDEAPDPEQLLHDLEEAKKARYQRYGEISKAIADTENPLTSEGRLTGNSLYADASGEINDQQVRSSLGEATLQRLKKADAVDVDEIIRSLADEISKLDDGFQDIFKELPDAAATPQEGSRRREGQARLTVLKATLLGMAEAAFGGGDLDKGFSAFRAANPNIVMAEPVWVTRPMADAANGANLNDPTVRASLEGMLASRVLNVTYMLEGEIAAKPVENLSPIETVIKQAVEARTITQKKEAEEKAARIEAEYNEKIKEAKEQVMKQAVSDGKAAFKTHFQGGKDFTSRFDNSSEGSAYLNLLQQNKLVSNTTPENYELRSVSGYVQFLLNVVEAPDQLDAAVAGISDRIGSDLGRRSRYEYEEAGKMEEWNDQIRQTILIQAHGNAMGILLGAIEYESESLNDATRAETLQKCLEVLGRGETKQALLSSNPAPTDEQRLAKKVLADYLQNPVADQAKWGTPDSSVKNRRLRRLGELLKLAPLADLAVLRRKKATAAQAS